MKKKLMNMKKKIEEDISKLKHKLKFIKLFYIKNSAIIQIKY